MIDLWLRLLIFLSFSLVVDGGWGRGINLLTCMYRGFGTYHALNYTSYRPIYDLDIHLPVYFVEVSNNYK